LKKFSQWKYGFEKKGCFELNGKQTQLQIEKGPEQELKEFEEMHTKTFMRFIKEYHKWKQLKEKSEQAKQTLC